MGPGITLLYKLRAPKLNCVKKTCLAGIQRAQQIEFANANRPPTAVIFLFQAKCKILESELGAFKSLFLTQLCNRAIHNNRPDIPEKCYRNIRKCYKNSPEISETPSEPNSWWNPRYIPDHGLSSRCAPATKSLNLIRKMKVTCRIRWARLVWNVPGLFANHPPGRTELENAKIQKSDNKNNRKIGCPGGVLEVKICKNVKNYNRNNGKIGCPGGVPVSP